MSIINIIYITFLHIFIIGFTSYIFMLNEKPKSIENASKILHVESIL
jgi:hypothetical protein